MAKTTSAAAVAERPTDALWLAALPKIAVAQDRLPARAPGAEGVIGGLAGAVTDMTVSRDGTLLVAAHYGDDAVTLVDTATLAVRSVVEVAEPYALAAADRVYVTAGGISEDGVVAIDMTGGAALAARDIDASARGLAVSPDGNTLYVARCGDTADVAVIDVESGRLTAIGVHAATVDVLRVSADGAMLFAALTTSAGASLAVIDTRRGKVLRTIGVAESISDIAVHRDGRRVFATGWDADLGGVLTVIDAAGGRVLDTVAVGGPTTQVVLTDSRAYVVHEGGIAVFAVANAQIVEEIAMDRAVSCVAVNPEGTRIYIADFEGAVVAESTAGDRPLRAAS